MNLIKYVREVLHESGSFVPIPRLRCRATAGIEYPPVQELEVSHKIWKQALVQY